MNIHFLGGASEVGASCVLIEAGGRRVLVDAGVRMGSAQKDRLPDLARIADLGGLDAVLLTHAHLDHSGALPLVHGAFPKAPVFMTEPTLGLIRILLLDAIKVMDRKSEQEDDLPLYPLPAVEALLGAARGVAFLDPVSLCGNAIRATLFPAGHVLGAAAVGIETSEGSVLVTGDVSITHQLTVAGMSKPRFSPDVVVCESTYGARLHASRKAEEERLADTALGALRDGRKVLIPAFALGRAQEVLLILRRALAREGAPSAPVIVDGMVRSVCAAYGHYASYLSPTLRQRAQEARGLFYTADGRIRPVQSAEERQTILNGGPCVIVASSGMLSGGASAEYAARLVQDENALVAITGYQDEEAPGRKLQEMASGSKKEIAINGVTMPVRCQVQTYALSAHADGQELCGLVTALGPKVVALVHGDADARAGLARIVSERGMHDIHLPASGDVLHFEGSRPRQPKRVTGIGSSRPFDSDALAELHKHLWTIGRPGRAYSVPELAELWYGSDSCPTDLAHIRELLTAPQPFFLADPKRPFLHRPADPASQQPTAQEVGGTGDVAGRMEQNAALALVDATLGVDSGLYRRGAERDTWTLKLYFRFPDVAMPTNAETLATIAAKTGWLVAVHPEPHMASLEHLARELLGPLHAPTRAPSILKDERRLRVSLALFPEPALRQKIEQAFVTRTGYALELQATASGTPAAKQTYDDTGRMEVNLALAQVDKAFANLPHQPHKKSKKADTQGPLLELSFITPEVGARYQEIIDDVAYRTGWRVVISPSVNQQAVLGIVGQVLPPAWAVTKGPGLDVAARKVRLKLKDAPSPEQVAQVAESLEQRAGFGLECSVAAGGAP